MKKLVLFIFLLLPVCLLAQTKDFCSSIETIINDAPTGFKAVKDSILRINESGIAWSCKVAVPGIQRSRVVSVMGLRYEGALYQTKEKGDIEAAYQKYKGILSGCLLGKGYELSTGDNFYPGLDAYKKLIYIMPAKDDAVAPPAHVSMEVDHSKQIGLYTIVLYIWQH